MLKAHLRSQLLDQYPILADEDIPIVLQHDRVYSHATGARINYTTYDLQRDQDIVHTSTDKADILVHTPGSFVSDSRPSDCDAHDIYPWTYARVIGIYHANVYPPGASQPQRTEFLHVRWFRRDPTSDFGSRVRRLERIQFVPHDTTTTTPAFGFIALSHVIRACHLIPAFHHLRTYSYLPTSYARDQAGDWKYYYVNRYAHLACISDTVYV